MIYLHEVKVHPDQGEGFSYFHHPEWWYDLRSVPDQRVANLTSGKFVLASGPVAPAGAVLVGDLGSSFLPGRKAGVASLLGLGESIVSDDVAGFLSELVVNLGDPSGNVRWPTPSVGPGRVMELWFNGFRIRKRVKVTDPEFRQTLLSKRIAYSKWRAESQAAAQALADAGRTWDDVLRRKENRSMDHVDRALIVRGDPRQYLKSLGSLVALYGVDYHTFLDAVPGSHSALPDEGVGVPATKIGDTFVDTAGTSLHLHTATGSDGGFGWTEVVGTELLINPSGTFRAENSATGAWARAEIAFSSSAHRSKYTRTAEDGSARNSIAHARYAAAADDSILHAFHPASSNAERIFKNSGGVFTLVGTAGTFAWSLPGTGQIECTASDALSGLIDGVVRVGPSTDATHNANLRAGMGVNAISGAGFFVEGQAFEAETILSTAVAMGGYRRRRLF